MGDVREMLDHLYMEQVFYKRQKVDSLVKLGSIFVPLTNPTDHFFFFWKSFAAAVMPYIWTQLVKRFVPHLLLSDPHQLVRTSGVP